jgi:hypothetical protein
MRSATAHVRGLRVVESVKVTDTQDGVVLLDVREGMCFPLDLVGTLIWKRLEQGSQVREIAQHIADTFHIPLDQASGDVKEFVQQLQKERLVINEDGESQARTSGWISMVGQFWRRLTQRPSVRGD